jgi:cytochrome c oxidase cbb3-type subunit 3
MFLTSCDNRPLNGAGLYKAHCNRCHGENGEGRRQGNATSLNNQDFLAMVSDDFLRATISRGRTGTEMPAFAKESGGPLTSQQITEVIRFLRGWQKEPRRQLPTREIRGSPETGAKLYRENCASCHGREGRGDLGMGPALNNQDFLKAASDTFLWETIARGLRDTPMFPSLKGLRGVRQLSEREIDDLVAFIRSWERR